MVSNSSLNRLSVFIFTLVLIYTSACLAESSKHTIRIGGVAALSGPAAGWGEMARLGWQYAIEEFNESNSEQKAELLLEDSRTNPTSAVNAFTKLTAVEHVNGMVGDVWDFITTPLIPLAHTSKTTFVSTIIDQSTHRTSPYFFTTGPRIDSAREAVEQFFRINPSIKTVAFLIWDNDWGYAYQKIWADAATKAGVKILSVQRSLDFASGWRTEISKIAPMKPDAIFFGYQADRILKQLHDYGLNPKILTTSNVAEELALKTVPEELSQGMYYTDWPTDAAFATGFQKRFHKLPMLCAADAYEAMKTLLMAVRKNSLDPTSAIRTISYAGSTGAIDFTTSSNGNFSKAKLFRVKDGVGAIVSP